MFYDLVGRGGKIFKHKTFLKTIIIHLDTKNTLLVK